MRIGKEIRRLREKAGVSAENLATWIGVKADKLRKWELRDSTPKMVDRILIEKYFDRPTVDLDKLDYFDFYVPPAGEPEVFSDPEVPYKTKKDYKAKYYKKLEDENSSLKEMLHTLTTLVQKVEKHLDVLIDNQLTMTAMSMAGEEVILEKLSKDETEYQSLLKIVDSRGIVKLKDALKRGNRLKIGNADIVVS